MADVSSATKGTEDLLLVGNGNANATVLDHITAAVDAFVGDGVMGDDVTLICLKIR